MIISSSNVKCINNTNYSLANYHYSSGKLVISSDRKIYLSSIQQQFRWTSKNSQIANFVGNPIEVNGVKSWKSILFIFKAIRQGIVKKYHGGGGIHYVAKQHFPIKRVWRLPITKQRALVAGLPWTYLYSGAPIQCTAAKVNDQI